LAKGRGNWVKKNIEGYLSIIRNGIHSETMNIMTMGNGSGGNAVKPVVRMMGNGSGGNAVKPVVRMMPNN
jgi:hypothetical protein